MNCWPLVSDATALPTVFLNGLFATPVIFSKIYFITFLPMSELYLVAALDCHVFGNSHVLTMLCRNSNVNLIGQAWCLYTLAKMILHKLVPSKKIAIFQGAKSSHAPQCFALANLLRQHMWQPTTFCSKNRWNCKNFNVPTEIEINLET